MELSLSNFGSLCRKRLLESTHCSQRCPVPIRSKIKSSNKYQQNPAAWEIFTVSSSKGFHSPDVWCNKQPICKIHHRIISPNNYIQQMEEQLNSDISQFGTCQLFPLVFKPIVRDAEPLISHLTVILACLVFQQWSDHVPDIVFLLSNLSLGLQFD